MLIPLVNIVIFFILTFRLATVFGKGTGYWPWVILSPIHFLSNACFWKLTVRGVW